MKKLFKQQVKLNMNQWQKAELNSETKSKMTSIRDCNQTLFQDSCISQKHTEITLIPCPGLCKLNKMILTVNFKAVRD